MAKHQCPHCHSPIALSWFFFSGLKTKYRCVTCSSLMGWNSRRKMVGMFTSALIPMLIFSLNTFTQNMVLSVSIPLVLATFVLWRVPKQYDLLDDDKEKTKHKA
ncbi:hypothetical protein PLEI_3070 [Photobacterium leiognathi lrivu.4.1]|uniref:Uncharacterized protein n=1 Tax=Photobacterium leiognathi lrivu.4.1 TaxID=1248232 RepID=V5F2E0_PHOLE|nr:hypothetical protein [Photobacterium leiognathi]GAD31410.1 hypothetical protein PLEI_3070 [Photobacterium leiognathi lrivu.4.1]